VAVTGGGALGTTLILALALLVAAKIAMRRRGGQSMCFLAMLTVAAFGCGAAHADADSRWSDFYGGIRLGASTSSMTAAKLAASLRADGYQITDAGAERGTASGTLFLGYELRNRIAVELAGTYVGRTRAALTGVLPTELAPLLADTAHIVRGSGDVVALEARYRWPVARAVDLDLRAGPYLWLTTSDVYVQGADQLHRSDHGVGYSIGLGPRFALGQSWGVGFSTEYLNSTSRNQFWQFAATLEYHRR
jgi:hypothetical protein